MANPSSILLGIKALRELGPKQVGLYAWYQVGLRSGYLRWKTRGEDESGNRKSSGSNQLNRRWLKIPTKEAILSTMGPEGQERLLAEADEIVEGRVRLFGGPPVPLQLKVSEALKHWTSYEKGQDLENNRDIKWTWESGRFGWASTLARAYHVSGEEKYPQAFWAYTEEFLDSNPANMGPHWVSAQEVALRMMNLAFAVHILIKSSHTTRERLDRLTRALADHAKRIPPTMVYARAQNNNHLLTEAAGLLTASRVLPEHPEAERWGEIGWQWFNQGIQDQIDEDGVYVQQSTNYQRLMLQAALWVALIWEKEFPSNTRRRLAAATEWLLAVVDPASGRAPNLGPNDSAYILPWTICPHEDFRPALQAASLGFRNTPTYPAGPWDEMSLWFGTESVRTKNDTKRKEDLHPFPPLHSKNSPIVLHGEDSWAYLRAARFDNRPGHADQLHLDLWWRGMNIAQDAGTYLYNTEPPWDNALAVTGVHNTITIEEQDQMRRAGRFLWLDWAQGEILEDRRTPEGSWERLVAQHDGYRRLGATHRRSVEYRDGSWIIRDTILPVVRPAPLFKSKSRSRIRLHWLLPDWPWEVIEKQKNGSIELRLYSIHGPIRLRVSTLVETGESTRGESLKIQIYRAGDLIYGQENGATIRGWVSRNYGYKSPALSFSVEIKGRLPITLLSEWILPG